MSLGHEDVSQANREFYDEVAESYLEMESYAYGRAIVKSVRTNLHLVSQLGGAEGKLLDFACGSGFLSQIAAQDNLFQGGVGIDISGKQVELFNQNLAGTQFFAIQGDAVALPFEDNSFSAVCGYSVLHHFFEPSSALAEATRVMRNGGVMYFDFEPDARFRKKFGWLVSLRRKIFDRSPSDSSNLEALAEYHNNFTLGLHPAVLTAELSKIGLEVEHVGQRFPASVSGHFARFSSQLLRFPSPLFFFIARKIA